MDVLLSSSKGKSFFIFEDKLIIYGCLIMSFTTITVIIPIVLPVILLRMRELRASWENDWRWHNLFQQGGRQQWWFFWQKFWMMHVLPIFPVQITDFWRFSIFCNYFCCHLPKEKGFLFYFIFEDGVIVIFPRKKVYFIFWRQVNNLWLNFIKLLSFTNVNSFKSNCNYFFIHITKLRLNLDLKNLALLHFLNVALAPSSFFLWRTVLNCCKSMRTTKTIKWLWLNWKNRQYNFLDQRSNMNQRRNRRNISTAQQQADNSPYLTDEDCDLINQGEDINVEELCIILRFQNSQSLLEQVQRIRSYRKYLGRHSSVRDQCLYIMCLIMSIMLAKGRHCIISNSNKYL